MKAQLPRMLVPVLWMRGRVRKLIWLLSASQAPGAGGGGCGLCQGTATPAGEEWGVRGLGLLGEPGLILTPCWDLGFFENLMKAPYP